MHINIEELVRMEKASYLLPDPGGEVARQLISELKRFRPLNLRVLHETNDPHIKNLVHEALYAEPHMTQDYKG